MSQERNQNGYLKILTWKQKIVYNERWGKTIALDAYNWKEELKIN